MKMKLSIAGAIAGAALLAAIGCSGPDAKGDAPPRPTKHAVAEAEVPKPVLDAWARSYPGAKAARWFERGGVYSAQGADATRWLDVKIASDGAVKESEEETTVDATPPAVKAAFTASPLAKLTLLDVYRRAAPDNKEYPTLFKFVLVDGGKPSIAVYDDAGKFVKQKDFPKEKLDKWRADHVKPARP
jgi:hypothetical protein